MLSGFRIQIRNTPRSDKWTRIRIRDPKLNNIESEKRLVFRVKRNNIKKVF